MDECAKQFLMSLDKEALAAMNCNQKDMIDELKAKNKELEEQIKLKDEFITIRNTLINEDQDCKKELLDALEELLTQQSSDGYYDWTDCTAKAKALITKYRG